MPKEKKPTHEYLRQVKNTVQRSYNICIIHRQRICEQIHQYPFRLHEIMPAELYLFTA